MYFRLPVNNLHAVSNTRMLFLRDTNTLIITQTHLSPTQTHLSPTQTHLSPTQSGTQRERKGIREELGVS